MIFKKGLKMRKLVFDGRDTLTFYVNNKLILAWKLIKGVKLHMDLDESLKEFKELEVLNEK